MKPLNFHREIIPIENLRLEQQYEDTIPESLHYDHSRYTLHAIDALTPEAISLLLQLHPIFVLQKKRDLLVVAGKRIFQAAAFSLPPTADIPVVVLNKQTTEEQLVIIRYLDLTVSSLLFRFEASAPEMYRRIDLAGIRQTVWRPPLDRKKSSFAVALQLSPAALSTIPVKHDRKKEVKPGKEEIGTNQG